MVDTTNPTNQFHAYQPQNAVPHSQEQRPTGLSGVLDSLGVDSKALSTIGDTVKQKTTGVRAWAQSNPGMVLGGLAATVIGLGLMRKRGTR